MQNGSCKDVPFGTNTNSGTEQSKPLCVTDALEYLECVKARFTDNLQVYSAFLDVMKEYKSKKFDMRGVLENVVALFKDHPDLIDGFNVFLDSPTKIEVRPDISGYQYKIVLPFLPPSQPSTESVEDLGERETYVDMDPSFSRNSNKTNRTNDTFKDDKRWHEIVNFESGIMNVQDCSDSLRLRFMHHSKSVDKASMSLASSAQLKIQQSPTVDDPLHDNAIQFMTKVKNRCKNDPDKYNKFLEVLHTHVRNQKYFYEPERNDEKIRLYEEVEHIFRNEIELLSEFKRFLPFMINTSINSKKNDDHRQLNMLNHSSNSSKNISPSGSQVTSTVTRPPSKSAQNTTVASKLLSRALSNGGCSCTHADCCRFSASRPVTQNGRLGNGTKRPSAVSPRKIPTSSSSSLNLLSPSKRYDHENESDLRPPDKRVKKLPKLSFKEVSTHHIGGLHDYGFFDRLRSVLKNKDVYENFLRCVILYNKEIIDKEELIKLVIPFFKNAPELFHYFTNMIGISTDDVYGDKKVATKPDFHAYNFGDQFLTNNIQPKLDVASSKQFSSLDFSGCKRIGKSYIQLPNVSSSSLMLSSVQTSLCKSVLNNTCILQSDQPDDTFPAIKKSAHDQCMFRIEDERFELDIVIEINAATIITLEAVNKKLQWLTPKEAYEYKLDDRLGGHSAVIHQKAIQRIYGEMAPDILDGLKQNPAVCIPIVLKRLKMKDEEWRKAQKGYNQLWRETTEKSCAKYLECHNNKSKLNNAMSSEDDVSGDSDEQNNGEEENKLIDTGLGESNVNDRLKFKKDVKVKRDRVAHKILINCVKGLSTNDGKRKMKKLLKEFNHYSCHGEEPPAGDIKSEKIEDNFYQEDSVEEIDENCNKKMFFVNGSIKEEKIAVSNGSIDYERRCVTDKSLNKDGTLILHGAANDENGYMVNGSAIDDIIKRKRKTFVDGCNGDD